MTFAHSENRWLAADAKRLKRIKNELLVAAPNAGRRDNGRTGLDSQIGGSFWFELGGRDKRERRSSGSEVVAMTPRRRAFLVISLTRTAQTGSQRR